MDGNAPLKLRYLPAPADPSQPSPVSANCALAKSDGLAKGRNSRAEPWTMSGDVVAVYCSRLGGSMYAHERVTLSVVAEAIAQIKGAKFAGLYENAKRSSENVFYVPDDTLVLDEASCLGIRVTTDLFGAVVPHPFVKTKAITHQLVDPSADRPEGWSSTYAEMVQDVVLPGFTAFSVDDARTAAARSACAAAGRHWRGCRCPTRSASLLLRPNCTRMPCASIRALWLRAGTTTLLRGSMAKAGNDQAFWKRRGALEGPAPLSSRR